MCRVARRDGQVAVVDDRERFDDVDVEHRVVRAQERRGGADRLGPEAGAGAVARRGVERDPDGSSVDAVQLGDVRQPHERPHAGEAGHDLGVDRPVRASHELDPTIVVLSASSRSSSR
jgi:hypothetical protein